MMFSNVLFFLGLFSLVLGQRYTANFVMTDPNIRGKISGTFYYSYSGGDGYMRFDHSVGSGVTEIYNFNTNVRYLKCGSNCDAESIAYAQPRYHLVGGSTNGPEEPPGSGCIRRTPPSTLNSRDQARIWTKSDGTICRVLTVGGVEYAFTNYAVVSTNFDTVTFINPTAGCPQKQCNIIADFVFVFDESGSISTNDFGKLKQFGVDVVNEFSVVGPTGVRFALIQFDTYARYVFHLSNDGRQTTINKIQATYRNGGLTCIPCGTQLMYNEFQTYARQVFRTAIVLTDGFNNRGTMTTQIMTSHRSNSNVVFAVGVGSSVSSSQLTMTASPTSPTYPKTVFNAANFGDLTNLLAAITTATCQDLPGSPCSNCKGFCSCNKQCICPNICDDGLKCTIDSCTNGQAQSGCTNTNRNCNDNNFCTTDTCDQGSPRSDGCVFTPKVCNDGNQCTADNCISTSGCSYPRNDSHCFGTNQCFNYGCNTNTGACINTTNFGSEECNVCGTLMPQGCEYIPCRIGKCEAQDDPQNPGSKIPVCVYIDDNCDDGSNCTADTCSVVNGNRVCSHENICDDGDGCTRDECVDRNCVHTNIFNLGECNDNVNCTVDTCDSALPFPACVHTEKTQTVCNDDDPCTFDECLEHDNSCRHTSNVGICEQREEIKSRIGTCYVADCDKNRINVGVNKTSEGNVQSFGDGCFLRQLVNTTVDICGVCFGDGSSCGNLAPPTEAFAIGGLFLAAIILAVLAIVAVAALLGGKKGYDIYLRNKANFSGSNTNPLYDAKGLTGTNPMYEK